MILGEFFRLLERLNDDKSRLIIIIILFVKRLGCNRWNIIS